MDSNELLEQEEAFHKMNAEIELRTRLIMKNVGTVISKQTSKNWRLEDLEGRNLLNGNDIVYSSADFHDGNLEGKFSSDSFDHGDQKACRRLNFLGNKKTRNNLNWKEQKRLDLEQSKFNPRSSKGMSAESSLRFMKAKGKLLQEEMELLKRELNIKTEELRKIQLEMKNRDEEKQKLLADIASFRDKVKKIEVLTVNQTEKLQVKDSANQQLKKEIEMLKQDVKKLNQFIAGYEAKLNKSKEENEKMKLLLKQSETNEKEARDKYRAMNDETITTIRKLEKQRNDLMSAIKKQVVLIENLKKQKEIMESEKGLNFVEKQFLRIMDIKSENESA